MRVLITGATGFLGRWAVSACLENGHEVGALVRPDDSAALSGRVIRFEGTLADPPWTAIDAFAPQVCIHSAWVATPGVYMDSPLNAWFDSWTRSFVTHLLDRSLNRVIGVGSCIEYIASDSEQARAPYVSHKKGVRAFLEQEATVHGAEWVWARVFSPFGEGEPSGKLCRSIVETLLRGECFLVRCPEAVRDYIAVQDVGRALAVLVEAPLQGDVDVGSGRPVVVREVAHGIAEMLGLDPDMCFEWGKCPDTLQLPVANPDPLRAMGWGASTSLKEGMAPLVESLRRDAENG